MTQTCTFRGETPTLRRHAHLSHLPYLLHLSPSVLDDLIRHLRRLPASERRSLLRAVVGPGAELDLDLVLKELLGRRPAKAGADTAPPELESHLQGFSAATPHLLDHVQMFRDCIEALETPPALQTCTVSENGEIWLSMTCRERPKEILRGDFFVEGLLFRGAVGSMDLEVSCRPVRLVCTNGMVMPVSEPLGAPRYVVVENGHGEGVMADVVEAAVSGRVLKRSADVLRRSARVPAQNIGSALVTLGRPHDLARVPRLAHRLARREQPTVYGMMNAVTRAAHSEVKPAARMRVERLAGSMLHRAWGLPASTEIVDLAFGERDSFDECARPASVASAG